MLKLMEAHRRPRRRAARLGELRHRGEGDRGLPRVRIFGIDPGSERTGYGCVETDGRRASARDLRRHHGARRRPVSRSASRASIASCRRCCAACRPDCVAIENLFHAANVRSALKLGHARGVAMLAAVEAGCPVVEYTPAEVKRAVVGYGRAEKHQVQQMIKLLLGLATAAVAARCRRRAGGRDLPSAFDAAGSGAGAGARALGSARPGAPSLSRLRKPRTWRQYRPPANG